MSPSFITISAASIIGLILIMMLLSLSVCYHKLVRNLKEREADKDNTDELYAKLDELLNRVSAYNEVDIYVDDYSVRQKSNINRSLQNASCLNKQKDYTNVVDFIRRDKIQKLATEYTKEPVTLNEIINITKNDSATVTNNTYTGTINIENLIEYLQAMPLYNTIKYTQSSAIHTIEKHIIAGNIMYTHSIFNSEDTTLLPQTLIHSQKDVWSFLKLKETDIVSIKL